MKLQYALPFAMSLLLAACSVPRAGDSKVSVEISGVNYSDQPITYALSDPDDAASVGGEPLDPFAGGGIMCCFRLPETWKPGIKVRVQIFDTHRDPVKDEIVDLPPYIDGKPGRIWTVHYQDGSVNVLSSDFGPAHAKWPGKVKGWPVPTVEYRRKLWERDLESRKSSVQNAQELLLQLRDNPEKRLSESWATDKEYRKRDIENFSGPNDPAYKEYLEKRYERYLKNSQEYLENWMREKP